MKLRNNLKIIRENLKMTQEEVARKAGIANSTYIRIEKGKRYPRLVTALVIAKVLKTSVDRLFNLADIKDVDE